MSASGESDAGERPDDAVSMVLMADPVSLSVVRERFRRWLAVLCWPHQEIDDVVMAVNEAVSLAVEHARPAGIGPEVRVAGKLFAEADGGRRLMIAVEGTYPWAPEPTDPDYGGHGLLMIHACMDAVELSRDTDGTTMMMTSVKVPPLAE